MGAQAVCGLGVAVELGARSTMQPTPSPQTRCIQSSWELGGRAARLQHQVARTATQAAFLRLAATFFMQQGVVVVAVAE